ncbi:HAD family hydrolase [Clostridium senegalense]|uniref:HAD family hydrolase n=1 Tax=Clostridium senegalense TaxID=1465809 RepID=A0A6M0H0L3_9CLOT|nr:HAD family hydrolase [Clostridium senegalense]NEU04129.1 HAD family hydrolase [Clostridium senegalense]
MKFEALVLDFDGTIADTSESIILTMQDTLKYFKNEDIEDEDIKRLIGLPLFEMFKSIKGFQEENIKSAVKEYSIRYKNICKNTVTMFEGVKETLENLHKKGVKLTIATSRGKDTLLLFLKELEIEHLFSFVACCDDVTKHKPAPDVVNLVLEKINVNKNKALVIGDTIYDVGMGQNAGCESCAVTYGNNTLEEIKDSNPEYIIDKFSDLISIVEG